MFRFLFSFCILCLISVSMAKVLKWQPVSFNRELPSWRTSQRSKQIQGYGPLSAFSDNASSRPLFFGSWRKRFDDE
ncbi:unnamed protein product [Caenorhabditis angaria]|uniref:Uncharacterized protein n=1 Tax=Caenorhabditis angaria TaxID=860376 RepID=A0A9P1J7E6_9PELO|nr:unnamed protein product [Caenorhabditis angaria]